MRTAQLIGKSLFYYRRTNLAVILGVGTAVSVLAGALLVGVSVRASLRDLFLSRLGKTDFVIAASSYFPESLAQRIREQRAFRAHYRDICPLVVMPAVVIHQESARRASGVQIYGINEQFWRFHEAQSNLTEFSQRDALVSESLAREIGIRPGDSILLKVEAPSQIPAESLHGRKEDLGRTIRLNTRAVLPGKGLGEFSLSPQQGAVYTIFVPLKRLQKELEREGHVNHLLVTSLPEPSEIASEASAFLPLAAALRAAARLDDLGINVRLLERQQVLSLEKSSTLLSDSLVEKAQAAASHLKLEPFPLFTYLANHIRVRDKQIPYSLVTGVDPSQFKRMTNIGSSLRTAAKPEGVGRPPAGFDLSLVPSASSSQPQALPPIWLNEWAARDLNAMEGDRVSLEYFLWQEQGRLVTQTADFRLESVVPMTGFAADRDVAPEYPGISDSDTLSDWDPPFPMDLGQVRPKDEEYWKQYRTTPKAYLSVAEAQKLWKSRFGTLTSLRFSPREDEAGKAAATDLTSVRDRFKANLLSEIDPLPEAFTIIPVREQGLAASQGATDFGEYFTYFSFFLVVAALLLATLFFRFGIEQRLREIGLLKAVGYAPRQIRNLFLTEGLALSILGSVLGVLGALVYGKFIMVGLRTWWVGAVGTIYLSLHVSSSSLAFGALGGIASTCLCIAWTLRTLASAPPRTLLTGTWILPESSTRRGLKGGGNRRFSLHLSPLHASIATGVVGGIFLVAALLQRIGETGGFFGAGILFLVSILALQMHWLGQRGQSISHVRGTGALLRLGCRNATHRPGRSVLCISLIALAAFIIVAVEAFRRAGQNTGNTLPTGTGGFPLFAQSLVPLFHDLNTAEGRDALGLSSSARWPTGNFQAFRFRVREGEDTSCLNLYQPQIPRIIAPTAAFLTLERFAFQNSLATDEAEKRNPWLLLEKAFPDGAVPVIGDASSLNYVLHRKLGQDWVLERAGSPPVLLRIVAALADSLFQRELLMSESNFKRLFPDEGGYRFFLINVPGDQLANATQVLEEQLADYGFDVLSTSDQLARFHQVENTYLSTFQALGGLGLLLGTLGLAIVLLRNVLERRQELALLRAIGYRSRHLAVMILAENALLLTGGLATGILCASLAITPALSARGGSLMALSLTGWLPAVLAAGLVSSTLATRAVLRFPLLESLRAE